MHRRAWDYINAEASGGVIENAIANLRAHVEKLLALHGLTYDESMGLVGKEVLTEPAKPEETPKPVT